MTVTLVPINSGYVKNFQIVGEGGKYDDLKCLFEQGVWSGGKLNGSSCVVTNYLSSSTVTIKTGVYTNSLPNGNITEYELSKSDWATFITNPDAGVDSTKYTRVYTNGALSSTSDTTSQKIKGLITYNTSGKISGFQFSEVV